MKFRSRWLVPALAAAALGLSGCGGEDEPRADGSASDAIDSTAGATTSATTPPPGSEPTTPPAETPTPTVTPTPGATTTDDSDGPDDDAPPPTTDPTPTQTSQPTGDPTEPPTDENDDGGGNADPARAVSRFETFLHALGAKDVPTMCEIAEPVVQQMADQGMGDCQTNFSAMADQPTPEQATALQSATVDPGAIDTSSDTVVIPATAVVAAEKFTSSDLGDYTLSFQGGDWFIVG